MAQDSHAHDHEAAKKEVWKIFWLLLIVTVVEVAVALIFGGILPKAVLSAFFVILSLLKAVYIVGVFMHMKYETTSLKLTTLLPIALLIWAIIALLYEGWWVLFSRINF